MPHSYIHINAIVFGNGYDTLLFNNTGNIGSICCTKFRISIYNKTNGNLLMSTTSLHNYYLLSYVANNTATEIIPTEIKIERIGIFYGEPIEYIGLTYDGPRVHHHQLTYPLNQTTNYHHLGVCNCGHQELVNIISYLVHHKEGIGLVMCVTNN